MDYEKSVLLVDDNEDDIDLTLHAFRQRRFPHLINVVHDGVEAMEFLFATGKYENRDKRIKPSLILLDLKMPRVDGLEVIRWARSKEELKDILIVVFTSSDEERDQTEAKALGANLYIRKPENYRKFTEVIHQVEDLLATLKPKSPTVSH